MSKPYKTQSNPDFHWPFDKKDQFMLFFSWCFWIVNILQVAGIGITIAFLRDYNIIQIAPAMEQLAAINIGLGSGVILVRVFIAIFLYLRSEVKNE